MEWRPIPDLNKENRHALSMPEYGYDHLTGYRLSEVLADVLRNQYAHETQRSSVLPDTEYRSHSGLENPAPFDQLRHHSCRERIKFCLYAD